jgi:lipoprotein-anchoring transpeptidase ErfK/SrfK
MKRVRMFLLLTAAITVPTEAAEFKFIGGMEIPSIGGSTVANFSGGSVRGAMLTGPTREEIEFQSSLPPGSVLVKTAERRLYFIEAAGRALAFRVGVGREGFEWSGSNIVTRKAEWPDWRPPSSMIAREAENGHFIPAFVKGGPGNPLGSRAIYIGETQYRIHGTDKPWSIGQASSSGCIRMLNDDVAALYDMVQVGARVVVE